jgi:hypothetical protein
MARRALTGCKLQLSLQARWSAMNGKPNWAEETTSCSLTNAAQGDAKAEPALEVNKK